MRLGRRAAALLATTALALPPSCPAFGPSASSASAAVLFLHALGDSGDATSRYLKQSDAGGLVSGLEAAGVRLLFPDSGQIPYRLAGGRTMSAWYDRSGLPPSAKEDRQSVEASIARLEAMLRELEAEGVPPSRVVVGGFSQGGGIALQLAYRGSELGAALAGVFVLSSYANDDSPMWSSLAKAPSRRRPPLFQRHGDADGYILPAWGEATAGALRASGVDVDFGVEPRLRHSLGDAELEALRGWLLGRLGAGSAEV